MAARAAADAARPRLRALGPVIGLLTAVIAQSVGDAAANEPVQVANGRICMGHEREFAECPDLPPCNGCTPVDCAFAAWSDWIYQGGCSQICARKRSVALNNNECGAPCQGPLIDTKRCPREEECAARDEACFFSEWSSWTLCKDEADQRQRIRHVLQPPLGNGQACEGPTKQTEPCGSTEPEDCQLGPWGAWTVCDVSCGGGHQAQMRRVVSDAKFGGKACSQVLRRTRPCNVEPCSSAANCTLSDWSAWEGCGKGSGTQRFRSRSILNAAAAGGLACEAPLRETAPCETSAWDPEPCQLSTWTAWEPCDRPCGGGQTFRSRTLLRAARNGGHCSGTSLREVGECNAEPCDGECKFGEWTAWSECSAACGTGEQTRTRTAPEALQDVDSSCSGTLSEMRACVVEDCLTVDCEWHNWEEWSACSRSCGGGGKQRSRGIKQNAEHGGKACSALSRQEVEPCNTEPCHQCLDGEWSSWSEWSQCSVTCGTGYRHRNRDVARQANDCGKPVEGVEDDYEVCSGAVPLCATDADCQLTSWSDWSGCSSECFGVRERVREVSSYAVGNGRPCDPSALKVIEQCNPEFGEMVSDKCNGTHPASCIWAAWSKWGECTKSCGGGQALRTRSIAVPAAIDGLPCEGESREVRACNTGSCDNSDCIDCQWSPWEAWSACSACNGQTYRRREILMQPNHCGRPCDSDAAKEVAACVGDCPAQRFCAWNEWEESGGCAAAGSCGARSKLRRRSLHVVDREPEHGSLVSGLGVVPVCAGTQLDHVPCPYIQCHVPQPVDCLFDEWGEWSAPTWSQLCERKREIKVSNREGGSPCSGKIVETKDCSLHKMAPPEDCEYSDWSAWSPCETKMAQSYRDRAVTKGPKNAGAVCVGVLRETGPCQNDPPAPESCLTEEWSEWSECSVSCGFGSVSRKRSILKRAKHGGAGCNEALDEVESCNAGPCGDSVDCVMGDWESWGSCNPATSTRERKRKVLQESEQQGKPCAGFLDEIGPCNATVDCKVSPWTDWDECDKSCGGGQMARQRQVVQNPTSDGQPCPKELIELSGCNEMLCEANLPCKLGDWSDWAECSSSCGTGQQIRQRDLVGNHGGCAGDLVVTRPCSLPVCEHQDCIWALWSEWSGCTCSCDGGQRHRERAVQVYPSPGGRPCDEGQSMQVAACNTHACSKVCVDGKWGDWSEWGQCSSTCRGGTTWRTRKVTLEANECGQPPAGDSQEVASCNEDVACETSRDCELEEWDTWSGCTEPCFGISRRSRGVFVHPHGNGQTCNGSLRELKACNPADGEALPAGCRVDFSVDCEISSWSDWGFCSAKCGSGQQVRSRMVLNPPAGKGAACPEILEETRGCRGEKCERCVPVDCAWEDWSSWGACAKCGGQRQRYRAIRHGASCGGAPCEAGVAYETAPCERECHDKSFCAFRDWDEWSPCSQTCGSGRRSRERGLSLQSAPLPPAETGAMNVRLLEGSSSLHRSGGVEGAWERSVDELELHARGLETRRAQELLVAFGSGLASFAAVAAVLLRMRRVREDVRTGALAAYEEAPSRTEAGRE